MTDIAVDIQGLYKNYGNVIAIDDLNLSVHCNEIIALVGPSGCGKTTALRLIAGFEEPDAGNIKLDETMVANSHINIPPENRGVGMVFQDYALFPHLTVNENVSFGVKPHSKNTQTSNISSMLTLAGLDELTHRYPHELSGGQRQRVALARALTPQPIIILLDEPFSNLDADLRIKIREEVRIILKTINITSIFVTHDQEEALFMGDRLAVMNKGRIEQIGSPEEIFHQPATRFVAEFMGNTDFLLGEVHPDGIQTEIGIIPQRVDLPVNTPVELAARADDITFKPKSGEKAIILARHFKGAHNIYRLRLPSGRLLHAIQPHTKIIPPGTTVHVWADPGHPLACFHNGKAVETRSNEE
ncbi:MAG: ABC transporter ATP-binding protein [Chloroflexi bacterium]|nr:ABC transporter ATP-binding protein [Chloroflexota bacterium]